MNEVSTGNITDISNSVAKKSGNIVAIQNHLSEDLQGLDKKVKSMMANESEYAAKQEQKRSDMCKICGKEGNGSQIVKHIEANHLEGVVIPCNHCEKMFRTRNALRQHKLWYHK